MLALLFGSNRFPVPLNEVTVSASAEGTPIVGQPYRITCSVLYPEGVTDPIIEWFDPDGVVSGGSGIIIGEATASPGNTTSSIEFNPFRSVHGGRFSCRASITSTTPPFSISKAANIDIVEAGKILLHACMQALKLYLPFVVVSRLPVTILASAGQPENGAYQVGSALTLTCQAQGGHAPITYNWNSTCSGLCFVLGETVNTVMKNPLHSIDSGSHTCSATDYTGRSGSDTLPVAVSGEDLTE